MSIQEHETIWFPGIYGGRKNAEFLQLISAISEEKLIELVQKRANEDGEWAIANGFVGENNENEPKMRRMMAFVADEENIRQCVEHLHKDGNYDMTNVDWICRELANASKWSVG